ncbi:MAG TPA: acyl-CoA dehydrogenase family protein [Acetobacteraceae bacterium]|jgi:alkylation response protein AidB-like acyl-CoA dehydrogenase|nr:acyl-CoA dehydrogenase family protein [Acetobacteraceae bacterium]
MDTTLSEEEVMIRETARKFLEAHCPTKLVREMEKDAKGYPPALWKQAADLGWQGLALPEQYGGSAMPLTYMGLVLEEVGRALAPLPLHSTVVAALAVARDGSEEVCSAILPGVAAGDAVLTWAFHEQNPQLVPEAVQCQAVADGNDFVINGRKMFVDNYVVADHCLVVCRTAPASAANAGLTLFLVDTKSAGLAQVPLVSLAKDKMSEVTFKDVRVPKGNMIGALNQGWPLAELMLEQATALLCAQMLGATRKDSEMAIEWSKYRKAFGQPIGAFQSIQHMCADMLMWIDGGNLLTYEALWKMDQGLPAGVEASQAKAFCNEKCEASVRICQGIHGGIGFMMEFDLQLWYRRVCAWTMRLGTAYEHRAKVARALLDQPGQVILGRPVPVVAEA